jgi:UDP-N-acetyl-D-galactosamine dehydrogenase
MDFNERLSRTKIAVIGLGYVGLPLAAEFGKKFTVIGFDKNPVRISELASSYDRTLELTSDEIRSSSFLKFTENPDDLATANVFIITVPTPVDEHKTPDLRPLFSASATAGKYLKKGDIVVYESTVYPGCTEEDCVPILERESGLKFNQDFFCGYSPERINPGDKQHTLTKIKKVVAGSDEQTARFLDALYGSIITAGTFLASSIKVAEASKVIENTQRDLNIAFVNELALIFERMSIDTHEVLQAAGTKWNFLPFKPGLVGGHCIGVDPYYLTHKAESLGYHPQVILAGRRINDNMGNFIAAKVVKLMINKSINIKDAPVLVLGITFKENCPDIRNSRVIDVIEELSEFGAQVDVYDPWASPDEVREEYGLNILQKIEKSYSAIVLAVSHKEFADFPLKNYLAEKSVVFDVKAFWDKNLTDARL